MKKNPPKKSPFSKLKIPFFPISDSFSSSRVKARLMMNVSLNYITSTDNGPPLNKCLLVGNAPFLIPISVVTDFWLEEFRKNMSRIAFDWAEQRTNNWRCQCHTAFSTCKACLKHISRRYFVRKTSPMFISTNRI